MLCYAVIVEMHEEDIAHRDCIGSYVRKPNRAEGDNTVWHVDKIDGRLWAIAFIGGSALKAKAIEEAKKVNGFVIEVESECFAGNRDCIEKLKDLMKDPVWLAAKKDPNIVYGEHFAAVVLGDPADAHLYTLGVQRGKLAPEKIDVFANNRTWAARIASEHGYTVRDVNMVG